MAIIVNPTVQLNPASKQVKTLMDDFKKLHDRLGELVKTIKKTNDQVKKMGEAARDAAREIRKMQTAAAVRTVTVRSASGTRGGGPQPFYPSPIGPMPQYFTGRMKKNPVPGWAGANRFDPNASGFFNPATDFWHLQAPPVMTSGRRPPMAFQNNPQAGMQHYASAAASGDPHAASMFNKYASMSKRNLRGQSGAKMFKAFGSTAVGQFATDAAMTGDVMGAAMRALASLGPEGMAAAAALAALAAVVTVTVGAVREWTSALIQGGGPSNTAHAAALAGSAFGVDLAGVGRGLMSGYGPVAAARAGVNPFGGPFGDNDYNAKGLKILRKTREIYKTQGLQAARRFAESANAPELVNAAMVSDFTFDQATRKNNNPAVPEFMKSLADFGATFKVLIDTVAEFEVTFSLLKSVIDEFTAGMKGIIMILRAVIDAFNELRHWIYRATHGGKDFVDALDDNKKATEDLTKALKDGIYGGGPRAAGSIPSKLNPVNNPGYGGVAGGLIG